MKLSELSGVPYAPFVADSESAPAPQIGGAGSAPIAPPTAAVVAPPAAHVIAPAARQAFAVAPSDVVARSRSCALSEASMGRLGGGVGLALAGALLGVGIYLCVRGDRHDRQRRVDFCRHYPFTFVGDLGACVDYWSRHAAPEQVCSRGEPVTCVTFEKPSDHLTLAGIFMIVVAVLGALVTVPCGAAVAKNLARIGPVVGTRRGRGQGVDDSPV